MLRPRRRAGSAAEFALAMICALGAAAPAQAGERQRIAALDMRMETEMAEGEVRLLNELMLSEMQSTGKFDVFGAADLAAMMNLTEEKIKVTGCADDACLAEIGGALGVDLLLVSSVGKIGDQYLINVKFLNVKRARVVARATEVVDKEKAKLVAAVRNTVRKVADEVTSLQDAADRAASNADPPTTPTQPGDTPTATAEVDGGGMAWTGIAAWVSVGLAGAAMATGGALGGMALADQKSMDDEKQSASKWTDLKDSAEQKATIADAMFGVAGAAAAAAVLFFVLDATMDEKPATAVAPLPGGAAVLVGGRW